MATWRSGLLYPNKNKLTIKNYIFIEVVRIAFIVSRMVVLMNQQDFLFTISFQKYQLLSVRSRVAILSICAKTDFPILNTGCKIIGV